MVIVLLIAYFVTIVAVGALAGKKENPSDFLIGSRQVGLWQTSFSMLAVIGGVEFVASATLAFEMGLAAIWFWVGFAIGMLVLGLVAKRIKAASDKGAYLTVADFVADRVDSRSGTLCAVLLIIAMFGFLTGQFIAAGSLFATMSGLGYTKSVLLIGLATLVYVMLGGYKAVVRTDFVQFAIMLVVIVVVVATIDIGNYSPQQLDLTAVGYTSLFNYLVLGAASTVTAAEYWQRIYASQSAAVARGATLITAVGFVIFGLSLSIVGIAAKARFPDVDPNQALYYGLFELTPAPVRSLAVVMVLAAVMSTIDTELFYISTSISRDLLHRNRPVTDDRLRATIRIALVSLTVGSVALAIFASDILTLVFAVAGLLTATSPVVFVLLFLPVKRNAAFVSMLGGSLSLAVLLATGNLGLDTSAVALPVAAGLLVLGQIFFRR